MNRSAYMPRPPRLTAVVALQMLPAATATSPAVSGSSVCSPAPPGYRAQESTISARAPSTMSVAVATLTKRNIASDTEASLTLVNTERLATSRPATRTIAASTAVRRAAAWSGVRARSRRTAAAASTEAATWSAGPDRTLPTAEALSVHHWHLEPSSRTAATASSHQAARSSPQWRARQAQPAAEATPAAGAAAAQTAPMMLTPATPRSTKAPATAHATARVGNPRCNAGSRRTVKVSAGGARAYVVDRGGCDPVGHRR